VAAPAQHPKISSPKQEADKSVTEVVGDLWQLLKDYGKQETIDPLTNLGRFVGFGAPGSILLALGVLLLSLGTLRALQTETGEHLTGSLTWVPYAITFVVAAALVAIAINAIGRSRSKSAEAAETKAIEERKATR
jgi:hypothetical protein